MLDLRVWPNRVADGSPNTSTPGKPCDDGKKQMTRLAKVRVYVSINLLLCFTLFIIFNSKYCLQLAKKHRNGHMPEVDWLDRLTFREIELINELEKRTSDYLYLMIEFPEVSLDGITVCMNMQ